MGPWRNLTQAKDCCFSFSREGAGCGSVGDVVYQSAEWALVKGLTGTDLVVVQALNDHQSIQLFATPWTAACQASLPIINSRSSLKFTSIESVMPSSHFILCRPDRKSVV